MTNISFFGASVTEQKDGYVKKFKDLISSEYNIFQNGYGSMHINDAGVCFIDKVLINNPQYCFLDWFSTWYTIKSSNDYIYLDCIVRKLLLINCKIIFLFFDANPMESNRLYMYKLMIEYAKKYNIYYIELFNNSNTQELLRDNVHTNELGSLFYGKKIYDYFMQNIINDKYIIPVEIPIINKYNSINELDVKKVVNNNISIIGNFELIGIYQEIGLFSGLCEIKINDSIINTISIWDQWCHFNRNTIKINIIKDISYLNIKVLQDAFDTTLCNKDINFTKYEKYMNIHKIFYFGIIKDINIY